MNDVKRIAQLLHAMARALEEKGFPQDPFIVQGHPQDPCCFFLALWRSRDENFTTDVIGVQQP